MNDWFPDATPEELNASDATDATAAGGQARPQSDAQRQGTGTGSASQATVDGGVATGNLSQHEARLQAVAVPEPQTPMAEPATGPIRRRKQAEKNAASDNFLDG